MSFSDIFFKTIFNLFILLDQTFLCFCRFIGTPKWTSIWISCNFVQCYIFQRNVSWIMCFFTLAYFHFPATGVIASKGCQQLLVLSFFASKMILGFLLGDPDLRSAIFVPQLIWHIGSLYFYFILKMYFSGSFTFVLRKVFYCRLVAVIYGHRCDAIESGMHPV